MSATSRRAFTSSVALATLLWCGPSHVVAQEAPAQPGPSAEGAKQAEMIDLPKQPTAPASNVAATAAAPAATPAMREWRGADGKPWYQWTRATGDWGGIRTSMEDSGLTIAGSFEMDFSTVFRGGVSRKGFTRRFLDLNATLDLDKAFGWKGGTVYADFYHYGGEVGNPAGDAQGVHALVTPRHLDQLAELWIQQVFYDGFIRVKAGKIDANVDFATIPRTAGFLTYNGNWESNMLGMPTYPDPATGVQAFIYPTKRLYFGFGFFDGATQDGLRTGSRGPATFFSDSKSDSWYYIGEAGVTWDSVGRLYAGRMSVGGWGHTGNFARFDGGTGHGTAGGYVTAEQQLTRRDESEDGKARGLYAFARANFADSNVSLIRTHVAAGIMTRGTFEGRDADEAGVMWSFADLSPASGAIGDEHNVELYYKLQLFGSLSITPDVQWISNPSGNPAVGDAWLGTLNVVVSF